jgi:HAD superfamily hydrolase (TIGR01459 family)
MEYELNKSKFVSLDRLVAEYEVFLIDQFGVLHDGRRPYPGAVEALRRLKRFGKKVVLISNSGQRASVNEERLSAFGFARSSYDLLMSSGEVAWRHLKHHLIGKSIPAHANCLFISTNDASSAIDGLDFNIVGDDERIDIILLTGCPNDVVDAANYDATLARAVDARVPLICTNPDKVMLTGNSMKIAAGTIAQRYADMGGEVVWIGKPYRQIYDATLAAIGKPERSRVVCLGDSMEHDIVGGGNAGCATVLVCTGIAQGLDDAALEALVENHGVRPDFVVPRFEFDHAGVDRG